MTERSVGLRSQIRDSCDGRCPKTFKHLFSLFCTETMSEQEQETTTIFVSNKDVPTTTPRVIVVHAVPGSQHDSVPTAIHQKLPLAVVLPLRSQDRGSLITEILDSIAKFDADVVVACGIGAAELVAISAKSLASDHRRLAYIYLGLDPKVAEKRMGISWQGNEFKTARRERLQGPVLVLTSDRGRTTPLPASVTPTQVQVQGVYSDNTLLPTVHPVGIWSGGDIGGIPVSSDGDQEDTNPGEPDSPTMHTPHLVRLVEVEGTTSPEEAALQAVESGELEGWVNWINHEAWRERRMSLGAGPGSPTRVTGVLASA